MPRTRKKRTKRNKRKTKNRKKRTRKIQKGGMLGALRRLARALRFTPPPPLPFRFGFVAEHVGINTNAISQINKILEKMQDTSLESFGNPVSNIITFDDGTTLRREGVVDETYPGLGILRNVMTALPNYYQSVEQIPRPPEVSENEWDPINYRIRQIRQILDNIGMGIGRFLNTTKCSVTYTDRRNVMGGDGADHGDIAEQVSNLWQIPDRGTLKSLADILALEQDFLVYKLRKQLENPDYFIIGNANDEEAKRRLLMEYMADYITRRDREREANQGATKEFERMQTESTKDDIIRQITELEANEDIQSGCALKEHASAIKSNIPLPCNERNNRRNFQINIHPDRNPECPETATAVFQYINNDINCRREVGEDCEGGNGGANDFMCASKNCESFGSTGFRCGVEPLESGPAPEIPPAPAFVPGDDFFNTPQPQSAESESSSTAISLLPALPYQEPPTWENLNSGFTEIRPRPTRQIVCGNLERRPNLDPRSLRQLAGCTPPVEELLAWRHYEASHNQRERSSAWTTLLSTFPPALVRGFDLRPNSVPTTGPLSLPAFPVFPALTDRPEPTKEIKQPEGVQPVIASLDEGEKENICSVYTSPEGAPYVVNNQTNETAWHTDASKDMCGRENHCIQQPSPEHDGAPYVTTEGKNEQSHWVDPNTGEPIGVTCTTIYSDPRRSIGDVAADRAEAEEETKETKEAVLSEMDKSLLAFEAFMQTEDCPSLSPEDMSALFTN